MAIGVIGIRGFRPLAVGEQHEAVGNNVRQRMHGIRDQALRVRGEADHQLHAGQHDVDSDADPGDALTLLKTCVTLRVRASALGIDHGF